MADNRQPPANGRAKAAPEQPGAFFGRRKGRPLRPQQQEQLAALLPQLQPDLSRPAPADIRALFSAPAGRVGTGTGAIEAGKIDNVRLEIGFGGGEHLLHEAARRPESGFIGVEPFVNGMAKMLAALAAAPHKAANIRLYADDALPLMAWLPAGSLAGIDIFYPDPWPKKKHWKRRFINAENLSRFARLLKPGGRLRFASDIDSYVNQVLQLAAKNSAFDWTAETAQDWQEPYPGWPGTRYEAKAKQAGRKPAYLTFIRR